MYELPQNLVSIINQKKKSSSFFLMLPQKPLPRMEVYTIGDLTRKLSTPFRDI